MLGCGSVIEFLPSIEKKKTSNSKIFIHTDTHNNVMQYNGGNWETMSSLIVDTWIRISCEMFKQRYSKNNQSQELEICMSEKDLCYHVKGLERKEINVCWKKGRNEKKEEGKAKRERKGKQMDMWTNRGKNKIMNERKRTKSQKPREERIWRKEKLSIESNILGCQRLLQLVTRSLDTMQFESAYF